MASVMAASRSEQSVVPHHQIKIKNPKKYGGGASISKPWSEDSDAYGVIFNAHSRPVSLSVYGQNQQPPLLPLPIERPLICRSLSQGPPPPTRRNRMSLTPKRSKQAKREEVKRDLKSASRSISELLLAHPTNRLGPDPVYLPNHFPQTFSDSVFNLSPPPSSLPFPKFTLTPKPRCNAVVDAGATDDLRRLLRLR